MGSILSEGEESPSPELIHLYQKLGFKLFSFPAPSHVVTATFPYTTALSIWLAARRVHPALDAYIKVRHSSVGCGEGSRLQGALPGWKEGVRAWGKKHCVALVEQVPVEPGRLAEPRWHLL